MEEDVHTPSTIGPYTIRGTIGNGAFSVVKLCFQPETGCYYACKVVPKRRLDTLALQQRFEDEIRISQQIHHPGVASMVDILQDAANYYAVAEFCPNGELFQYIADQTRLPEDDAKVKIMEIMDTVRYIHGLGIVHRDLKPENILLDHQGHLKIVDFGLSRYVRRDGLVETACGSPCYASPECVTGEPYNGKANDVWSVGVVLFAMVTGRLPWTKRKEGRLFEQIRKGEYVVPEHVSNMCRDLIQRMLTVDWEKRITMDQAMEHKWFEGGKRIVHGRRVAKMMSMRKVDEFFGVELKWDAQEMRMEMRRQVSKRAIGLTKTMAEIRDAGVRVRKEGRPHVTRKPVLKLPRRKRGTCA